MAISAAEVFGALREPEEGELEAVFSPLGESRFARGLETIYEGYLLHYGRPRRYVDVEGEAALVLGDYLYAQGLARIASLGDVAAVYDLAELISLCAPLRADPRPGAGSAALLGQGRLADAREALSARGDPSALDSAAREAAGPEAVDRALTAHARHVDR